MARKKKEETTVDTTQEKFKKNQLVKSTVFQEYKDILNVILDNDTNYTIEEVKEKIKEFKEEEVK